MYKKGNLLEIHSFICPLDRVYIFQKTHLKRSLSTQVVDVKTIQIGHRGGCILGQRCEVLVVMIFVIDKEMTVYFKVFWLLISKIGFGYNTFGVMQLRVNVTSGFWYVTKKNLMGSSFESKMLLIIMRNPKRYFCMKRIF